MVDDSDSSESVSFEEDGEDVSINGGDEEASEAESNDELVDEDEDQSPDEEDEEDNDEGEDEDDEDDDDDENGVEEEVKETLKTTPKEDVQDITTVALERTIFVGNLPSKLSHKDVAKMFKACGPVESARIRSIVPEKEKLSQKVASITKRMHPKVDSVNAYVVFAKSDNDESITKALAMNGKIIDDHRIRVDRAQQANAKRMTLTSRKKSVFVGNLRFDLRDDDLISHFQKAGSIDYVRLIRDKATGMGKGFGFVKFMERAAVKKALEMNDTDFKGRKLRVKKIDEKMKMNDSDKETTSPKDKTNDRPNKKFKNDKSHKNKGDDGSFRKDGDKQGKNNSPSKQGKNNSPNKQAASIQSRQNNPNHQTRQKNFNKPYRNGHDGKQTNFAKTKKVKFDLKNTKKSNDQQKREGPRFSKVRVNKMTDKKTKTILKKKLKKEFLKK